MSEPVQTFDPAPDREAGEEAVIITEGLGVRYRLPNVKTRSLKNYAIKAVTGQLKIDQFWALRDINLSVHDGEILGLIGKNGAGKTTLLKVIARVLKPTEGRVIVRGNVAPLLGVGAAFHLELTGRENVFLNGSLLGFSNQEMEEKFERIVDFAELWDYIDQPLRTYSSGMRARLGFAVATDAQPDVLIVDEILSVGDHAFREKSEGRMREFREKGATIMLVTHNMETIKQICHRAAWIHQGRIEMVGETEKIVESYLRGHRDRRDNRPRPTHA